MKTNFKSYFILLIAIGSLLAGCSKGGLDPDNGQNTEVSRDNSLRNFSFKKDSNPALQANFSSTENGDLIYITVPDGVSLKSLVPFFNIHEKATVKAGTTPVENGVTAIDFSETVNLTVTSESGSTRTYSVLAKNGDTQIDNKIYSFMVEHDIPGVSVAISKDEEIVYTAAYGFANTEKRERTTPDHMFRLASMSKQHTAIAIMKLMEMGKLKLTDTVFGKGGLLYEAFGDNMKSSWKSITVEHLLSHTSCIETEAFFGAGSAFSGKNLNERISILLSQGSMYSKTPGSFYDYNNSNFGILGKIVEELSGKSFMQFLKDEIYTPNGITGIDAGDNDGPIKGEVTHYSQNSVNPYDNNVEAGLAAGGVVASATGLMKLMALVDYGTKVPDIFTKETLDRMYTQVNAVDEDGDRAQYALGWRTGYSNYPDWKAFHGGTLAGVCPIWARSFDNINGAILCNSRSYNQNIDYDLWHMLEDIQEMYR